MSILKIQEVLKSITEKHPEEAALSERIFTITERQGSLVIPEGMNAWVENTFGSVDKVKDQKIIKVLNKITFESSLFNALRSERPMEGHVDNDIQKEIQEAEGGPFCDVENKTPEDAFGRIKGAHGTTSGNIAKYDKWHSLVVFENHNPMNFTEDQIVDYLNVAKEWWKEAHSQDPKSRFPFLVWQCLWKSGSSIVHGHMQLLLTSDTHYGNIELLNKAKNDYREKYGTNYFQDLIKVHQALGLAVKKNSINILAYLTPKKEKEIMILGDELNDEFAKTIYQVTSCLRDEMGVESFTCSLAMPPLDEDSNWEGFPVIFRVIDRGSLKSKTTDFGSMEIYSGSSVVSSDPFKVIEKIKTVIK